MYICNVNSCMVKNHELLIHRRAKKFKEKTWSRLLVWKHDHLYCLVVWTHLSVEQGSDLGFELHIFVAHVCLGFGVVPYGINISQSKERKMIEDWWRDAAGAMLAWGGTEKGRKNYYFEGLWAYDKHIIPRLIRPTPPLPCRVYLHFIIFSNSILLKSQSKHPHVRLFLYTGKNLMVVLWMLFFGFGFVFPFFFVHPELRWYRTFLRNRIF